MVSFAQAVKDGTHYCLHFDYKGRSSRSEFWWFQLGLFLFATLSLTIIAFVDALDTDLGYLASSLLFLSYYVFVQYCSIILCIRRLHDRNMRGWWYLLILIPLLGPIALLVLWCLKGTTGYNRFGPDPIYPNGNGFAPFNSVNNMAPASPATPASSASMASANAAPVAEAPVSVAPSSPATPASLTPASEEPTPAALEQDIPNDQAQSAQSAQIAQEAPEQNVQLPDANTK